MNTEFDDIRPYLDSELPQAVEELLADEAFRKAIATVMPEMSFDVLAGIMRACRTKYEFQTRLCYGFLQKIIDRCTTGLTLDYAALPHDREKAYTYLSNHRDIVLDSAFLSMLFVKQGMDTVEIAIGDNLLIYPWIKTLVRINKSFIVKRGLSIRQQLESSMHMSRYMHYAIGGKKQSIWMAQREGRAKDSDDRTQESVLKMLAMGGEGTPAQSLRQMHIVPLAISYEYDPCDFLKAKEFQQKRDNPSFKKSMADDLESMRTGIMGYKGHVHFQVAPCIDAQLEEWGDGMPRQAMFARVAALIDKGIHSSYRIYPNNYVAYDLLDGSHGFEGKYSADDKARFCDYLDRQLERIDLPVKDTPFLRGKMLHMYANPLVNQLAAQGED